MLGVETTRIVNMTVCIEAYVERLRITYGGLEKEHSVVIWALVFVSRFKERNRT